MLDREERQKIMDANPPVCDGIHYANTYLDWRWQGCGFGQLSFSFDRENGWECSNEMMSPEAVRKILHAYADYVADQLTPVIIKERDEWQAELAARELDINTADSL